MGLSTWSKVGYALQGALTGVAANIEKEEERREKTSNTILAGIIKNADKAMELSTESISKKKELDAKVATLTSRTYIDPVTMKRKPITEAQAIYAIETYGDKLSEKLANNEIAFSSDGKVIKTPPALRGKLPNPLDAKEDQDNFLFYKGRERDITGRAVDQAKSMGYSTEGYPVYDAPTATGVDEIAGVGNYTRGEETLYEFNQDGGLLRTFKKVTLTNKSNPTDTRVVNVDLLTGKPIEVSGDAKIAANINAGKATGISDHGIVLIPTDSGYQPLYRDGKPVKGFEMESGRILVEGDDGTPEKPVGAEGAIVHGVKRTTATGVDFNDYLNFNKVTGVKEYEKAYVTFEGLAEVVLSVDERVGNMMKLNAEIGDAGYSVGGFLTAATNSTIKAVQSTGAFIQSFAENQDLQGTSEEAQEARYTYIENQETSLRGFLASGEELLSQAKDAVEERAIKMALLETEAILLAYDAAKATGDTRISNQDFDAFIKTIRGTSVKETYAKLLRLHERTMFKYEQALKTVENRAERIDYSAIPDDHPFKEYLRKGEVKAGDYRHPNKIRADFKVVADQYKPEPDEDAPAAIPDPLFKTVQGKLIATIQHPTLGDLEVEVPAGLDPQNNPDDMRAVRKMAQDVIDIQSAQ